jgi:serine/threonine protein kinase
MGELLLYTPLMPGNDEIAQLESIFKLLGAPSEAIWPGLRKLPLVSAQKIDLSAYLRLYPLNNLALKLPKISEQGLQLINVMLTYNPDERIKVSARVSDAYLVVKPCT